MSQFKAHQFKAPFWQKLPPKKTDLRHFFAEQKFIYWKKKWFLTVIGAWFDQIAVFAFFRKWNPYSFIIHLFFIEKSVIFSWFLKKWMTENLIRLLLTAVNPCRLAIFKIYQSFLEFDRQLVENDRKSIVFYFQISPGA